MDGRWRGGGGVRGGVVEGAVEGLWRVVEGSGEEWRVVEGVEGGGGAKPLQNNVEIERI